MTDKHFTNSAVPKHHEMTNANIFYIHFYQEYTANKFTIGAVLLCHLAFHSAMLTRVSFGKEMFNKKVFVKMYLD
jgi:hypothetical protein